MRAPHKPVLKALCALMNNRETLFNKLKQAALLVREGGDVYSDYFNSAESFAVEIERLAVLVLNSSNSPMAFLRALLAKKRAKYSWCAPSFDLDDYLAGTPQAAELGNSIYALL